MVVVEIQLVIGVAGPGEGGGRGKGVDEGVLPLNGGQLFCNAGGQQVGCRCAPAVAAHPQLEGAQVGFLGGGVQIAAQVGQHLARRDHEARVPGAHAGVQVAHPLAAVAAAPQHHRRKGDALSAPGEGLPGQRVAHKVAGGAHVDVVMVIFGPGKAQRLKGVGEVGLPAHIGVGPVFRIAGRRVEGRPHHAQAHLGQGVVVLKGGVVKQALAVMVIAGQIVQAQLAAEPHRIVPVRHRPADGGALGRCRPGQGGRQRRGGRAAQRPAEIASFHLSIFLSHFG